MTIRIENICPDFFAFWEQAQGCSLAEQKQLWQTMYEELHRDVFDVYYRRWGDPARLDEALGKFSQVVQKLQEIVHDVEHRIKRAVTNCAQVFDMPESDFEFVVMVGLFTSNGWATTFRGKPTSFLALECFTEPHYLDILIAHETAHSFHTQCGSGEWPDFAVGEGLFREGLATMASAVMYPGAMEAEYLWFGPGYNGWMAECLSRWPELCQRFLRDLAQIDETLYTAYFGGKGPEVGLPKRVGYIVGYRAIAALSQRHTIAEMARWSPEHSVAEVKRVLKKMLKGCVSS
ncbi:MAG: DUF2268 domain-containing putative Zn-dependent protease [Chloroflexota bacterium]